MYKYCEKHNVQQPTTETCDPINSCVVGVLEHKKCVTLNKPFFVGSKILELSKVFMFDFYYNVMLPKFGERMTLLMTDTDSLVLHIKSGDACKELMPLKEFFDFSNYAEDHFLYAAENSRVPGKMKDEFPGVNILEFVGLRAKAYAFRTEKRGVEVKKAKGIKKNVIKRDVVFDEYMKVLQDKCVVLKQQRMIRSYKMKLFTVQQEKIALSGDDDKRWICPNGVDSLPWGHKDIPC